MSTVVHYLPSVAGALLGFGVSCVSVLRRPGPGWGFMALMGLAVSWWCLLQGFWLASKDLDTALLVNRLQYVSINLTTVFWCWMALAQVGRRRWLAFPRILAFLVVPAGIVWVAWTREPGNSLLWLEILVGGEHEVPVIRYGPLFYVMALYAYAMFLGGCANLIGHYMHSPHYRAQLWLTGVFPIALMLLNAAHITGRWPSPVDPTPIALAVGCALLLWGMLRHRLLEISPVGRAIAFDSLNEGVLILDDRERVVDANAAAGRLLGRDPRQLLGRSTGDLLQGLQVGTILAGAAELPLHGAAGGSHVQPGAARIAATDQHAGGYVVTLRDTTGEREARRALMEAQRGLQEANVELERMAHTDVLTGLANRRLLLARLDEEIARARRSGAPLALLMIDLDHFKQVNDCHGHRVGDAVLESTGAALRSLKRPADVAARYGGEELSLLLVDTDAAGACAAAERVRQLLGGLEHRGAGGVMFHVTSSVGVALLAEDDADTLIERADAALYRAKDAGRDRVCLATPGGGLEVLERGAC